MPTDKTGAEAEVVAGDGGFTVLVAGKPVGRTAFADRGNQRVFYHTEVDEQFGGRGLAGIVIGEALAATRADGKRVVATCPTVGNYLKKHPEFDDIADKATPEILRWVQTV